MYIYIENDVEVNFDFDYEHVANDVCQEVLNTEACPFDCEINVLITDNNTIKEINSETRNIDKETDVLSFPNLFFDEPSQFELSDDELFDYINPENNHIILGEIILSIDRIYEQAKEYGHSVKREYAFLITHSMLHLCGYDHMVEEDAAVMEEKQNLILEKLGITRD